MRIQLSAPAVLLLLLQAASAQEPPVSTTPTAPLVATPDKLDEQEWFIQVWFDTGLPAVLVEDPDPGRVEISINGRFVACQSASHYTNSWKQEVLVPTALGATARGRRGDIEVKTYGVLGRVAKPRVKITLVPSVPTRP